MKTKMTLLATAALAVLAAAVPAQAGNNGWYVSLSGGANWMSDKSFFASNGTDTLTFGPDSDTGWIVSGAVGFSLHGIVEGLRAEAEVAYRNNQVNGAWLSTTGASDTGRLDYEHSTLSVMANVWYDFTVADVRPYIGGGIGWADSDLDGAYVGGSVPAINVSDNGFAWQLGAGINFEISPSMQLGVGYRYFEGPDVRIGAPDAANGVGGDVESRNHAVMASLIFGM